jgi:aminoglycoside 2'-N-acetyltransferase I
VTDVRVAHTADLDDAALEAVQALLVDVFREEWSPEDWDHALGGLHAMVWEEAEVVAHASLVQRRLLHGGRALRAGYVEAVAVRAHRRRRGLGGAVMGPLERAVHGAYDVGALSSSEEALAFYASRGWKRWLGTTSALTPAGIVPTPDDESVHVLAVEAELDLGGELTCDWRDGELW